MSGKVDYPFYDAPVVFRFHGHLAVIVVPAMPLDAVVQLFEESFTLFCFQVDVLLGAGFQFRFAKS